MTDQTESCHVVVVDHDSCEFSMGFSCGNVWDGALEYVRFLW